MLRIDKSAVVRDTTADSIKPDIATTVHGAWRTEDGRTVHLTTTAS